MGKTESKSKSKNSKLGTAHNDQLQRLNRIEGQVRGVVKMIEDQRYCVDILVQLKAIKAAIHKVENHIVAGHLSHCVKKAISSKDRFVAGQMLEEIQSLLGAHKPK